MDISTLLKDEIESFWWFNFATSQVSLSDASSIGWKNLSLLVKSDEFLMAQWETYLMYRKEEFDRYMKRNN